MKVAKNTLEPEMDRWEDPGDYPNALAAGPLPPGPWQVVAINGEVVLELDDKEMCKLVELGLDDFISEETEGIEMPAGILSVTWQVDKVEGNKVTLSATDCEGDPDYRADDGPDYDEDR